MKEELLSGIRVLDFTDFLAGPYCGMYLADMGAEVIKIENLKSGGNFSRTAGPKEKTTNRSMYFQNLNRNKKGVALDLKSEDGKKLFTELVKSADVLLENNRPGVMKRLGFDWEVCKKINPRLIFASISGYGQYGTNASRPGYDLIAQAMSGCMSITGWPGSEPTRAGMCVGDLFGGLNAAVAILASLVKRERNGHGQYIDVALVDSVVGGLEAKLMQYVYDGKVPPKTGNRYISSAPYDSFRAKDNYFVIASGTDAHFVKLCGVLGMPELLEDPRFANTQLRNENYEALKVILEGWTTQRTVAECVQLIESVGVPAGEIYDLSQVAHDENIVKTREMLVTVDHPEAGKLTVIGNPIKMSDYPVQYKKAAPDMGEDNLSVFKSVGFTDAELEAYKKCGVIN